jgi:hypothetical protein
MNSKNTFKKLFIFFLFSLLAQIAVATEITTRLDRSQININDSIQLIFSTTESPDVAPDFSPLEKDFEILNQNQQSSSSWVNGRSTQSVQWVVKLMAKQAGNLTIPAISFGKDTSKPISISVSDSPVPNETNNRDEDLFLQVEVTPKTAYVQSQVIYTVRLFRKVQITQASLNEPELADAIIEKLEEDVNYTTELNGRSYAVIEQKYAIFPQKSGSVTIAPVTLTAEVVTNTRRRFNGFFNRQSTQSKKIVSESISLDIKPAPTSFKGKHWIPSEHVHLEEKWSGDTKEMKVGEPLTRTLTLLAKGTTVAQLPELHDEKSNSQLKTYPDQPVLKEKKIADGLMAFREEKVAFIPSKPGEYTLPAINIPWFNTQTQTMEMASIPETKVIATGAAMSQDAGSDNTITPLQLKTEENKSTTQTQAEIQPIKNPLWKWLSLFLGLGWLTTLFFLFKKPKPKQEKTPVDNTQSNLKEAVKSLKKACTKNNPSQAKDALLAWGKTKFNSNNLSAIGSNCESTLQNEIHLLSQSLYSTQTNEWQGKNLLQAFKANEGKKEVSDKVRDELEPLYRL